MEFKFNVNDLFKQPITELNQTLIPPGFQGDRRALWDAVSKVAEVVNEMGNASASAQGLSKPITTADRLRNSEHKIYIMTDKDAANGKGAVIGMLKVGKKGLYIFDRDGQPLQVAPTCVLDFYVHESRQRHGLGRHLFEHMLQKEQVDPVKMAIDRPSEKFLGFLNKHYNLNNPIRQMNNYVVFEGFFPEPLDKGDNNSGTPRRDKQPANGLQKNFTSPYGRYGAPRPPCSMGQIIHNQTSTVKSNQEPAGFVVNQTQSAPSVQYQPQQQQQQQQYGQGYYEQQQQQQQYPANYQYGQNIPQQYVSQQQIGDGTIQTPQLQQLQQQQQQQYPQPNIQQTVIPQNYQQQQPNMQQYPQYAQQPNVVASEKTANMAYGGQYAYPTMSQQPGMQLQQIPSDKMQAQNMAAYQQYYNTQSLPNMQMSPQYQQQMVYHAQTVPQQVAPQQQEMIEEKLMPQIPQTTRQMPPQTVSQPQMMVQGYAPPHPSMMQQRQTVSEGQMPTQQTMPQIPQQQIQQTQQNVPQMQQQPTIHHQNLQHLQQMPVQQQIPQVQQMPPQQQMPVQQQTPQVQQMPPQQQMVPQIPQQIMPQQYIPQVLPQGQTMSLPTIPQNQTQMTIQTPSVTQMPQIVPQYIQQRQTTSQPQIGQQGYVLPQTQTLSQPQVQQTPIPNQYQYYDRDSTKMIQQVGGDRQQQQQPQQNVTATTNKPNASGNLTASQTPNENLQAQGERYQSDSQSGEVHGNPSPKLERPRSLSIQLGNEEQEKLDGKISNDINDIPDEVHEEPNDQNGGDDYVEVVQEAIEMVQINEVEAEKSVDEKPTKKTPSHLTEQGFFDLKFYHNKLW